MAKYKQWDVWLARVSFQEDASVYKDRPVLVIDDRHMFVMAHYMTSASPRPGCNDYPLRNWQAAGLSKETTVRIDSVIPIDDASMIRKLGTIDANDRLIISLRAVAR